MVPGAGRVSGGGAGQGAAAPGVERDATVARPAAAAGHSIHDFSAKLRQPSAAPTVEAYVEWRRAVRAARASGAEAPAAPEIAPISINLDLTTACNYRCTHCIDWDILNTKHRLAEEDLRASIALMATRGLRSVILIGGESRRSTLASAASSGSSRISASRSPSSPTAAEATACSRWSGASTSATGSA